MINIRSNDSDIFLYIEFFFLKLIQYYAQYKIEMYILCNQSIRLVILCV